MPKPKRGKTIKLSIMLSSKAKENIEAAAKNLGVSKAGIILFELAKLLKNPPTESELQTLEQNITLERKHFVLTINETLNEKINNFSENYKETKMKKNRVLGYILSNHFEDLGELEEKENTKPQKIMLQVNEIVKKKMLTFSEDNFIPLSALVSYAVLNAENIEIPYNLNEGDMVKVFTNVPSYVHDMIIQEAEMLNIRENFYTGLCIYNQFTNKDGEFYLD